jgi:hypothetical protein
MHPAKRDGQLNAILAAYLRAPTLSWRTVADAATEVFGPGASEYLQGLIVEMTSAVDQMGPHVRSEVGYEGHWDRRRAKAADEWMALRWPWMTKRNRRAAFSLGRRVLLW